MKLFDDFYFLVEELKTILDREKLKLSTAESCTGGLLGAILTSIPGSSTFFEGSLVTYSNYQKINILKVKEEILKEFGAVSEECAYEMAKNLKKLTNSDIAISVTGIAGPEGGTPDKPVGTVFSTIIIKDMEKTFKFNFSGHRNLIRVMTVQAVLENLLELLKKWKKDYLLR